MEYRVTRDSQAGWHVITFSGLILPNDLIEMLKELWTDPGYASATRAIWDFSGCETDYHFQDIFGLFRFVQANKQQRGPGMIAVVAPKDMEFGMSRMYASLGEQSEPLLKVFRLLKEAQDWLGEQQTVD